MICLWPQQARALSLVDQSKQYRILLMISGVAATIGRFERGGRPRLNSFTQLYTVVNAGAMNIIQLGFDFFRH